MINAAKRIRELEQKEKNGRWNGQCTKRQEIQLA